MTAGTQCRGFLRLAQPARKSEAKPAIPGTAPLS
jgi:hypothetical protein